VSTATRANRTVRRFIEYLGARDLPERSPKGHRA
jgi:hypothetical protein